MLSYTTVQVVSDTVICYEGTDYTDKLTLPPVLPTPNDTYWVLQNTNIRQVYNQQWVVSSLASGSLMAVCDGSYKPKLYKHGIAAAMIIESTEDNNNITGTVATSGITADPYRAELLGVYMILSAIRFVAQHNTRFTTGLIRIGCDNEMAGWMSGVDSQSVAVQTKHFDLVKAIRRIRSVLRTKTSFYHIYGHQDRSKPIHSLSRDAQLNVLVDNKAQEAFDQAFEHFSFKPNKIFFQEGWTVSIGGIKLQDNIAFNIRQWIGKNNLRRYLYQKDLIACLALTSILHLLISLQNLRLFNYGL